MTEAVATLLECVGEDPAREGLLKTPLRMAKALMAFTAGYTRDLQGTFFSLAWILAGGRQAG
jgi:GTP cyclohydrolase I